MDEEIERLVVSVRADTAGFAKDVADMKGQLDGPFASGLERAGSVLESTLSRAIRRGSLEFEDLRRVALSVMNDIAGAAINSGLQSLFGGSSGGSGGGLANIGTSLLSAFLGAPGRARSSPCARPMIGMIQRFVFLPRGATHGASTPCISFKRIRRRKVILELKVQKWSKNWKTQTDW